MCKYSKVEHSTVKIQTKFSTAPPNPGKLARKSSNNTSNSLQSDKKKIMRRNSEEKVSLQYLYFLDKYIIAIIID